MAFRRKARTTAAYQGYGGRPHLRKTSAVLLYSWIDADCLLMDVAACLYLRLSCPPCESTQYEVLPVDGVFLWCMSIRL